MTARNKDTDLIFEAYVTEISDPERHAWSADREDDWGSMEWRKKAFEDGEQVNIDVVLNGIRERVMKLDDEYNRRSTSHYWHRIFTGAIENLEDFLKIQKGEDIDIGSHGDIGVQIAMALGGGSLEDGESTEDAARRQKAEQAEAVVREFGLNSINQIQILKAALGAVQQYAWEAVKHEYGEINLAGAWHVSGNSEPAEFMSADMDIVDLTRAIMNGLMQLEDQLHG